MQTAQSKPLNLIWIDLLSHTQELKNKRLIYLESRKRAYRARFLLGLVQSGNGVDIFQKYLHGTLTATPLVNISSLLSVLPS